MKTITQHLPVGPGRIQARLAIAIGTVLILIFAIAGNQFLWKIPIAIGVLILAIGIFLHRIADPTKCYFCHAYVPASFCTIRTPDHIYDNDIYIVCHICERRRKTYPIGSKNIPQRVTCVSCRVTSYWSIFAAWNHATGICVDCFTAAKQIIAEADHAYFSTIAARAVATTCNSAGKTTAHRVKRGHYDPHANALLCDETLCGIRFDAAQALSILIPGKNAPTIALSCSTCKMLEENAESKQAAAA